MTDAEAANAAAMRSLWHSFQARDWTRAAALLHPDLVVLWPHTRERIRGGNYLLVNRHYPEPWSIAVVRVLGAGDWVVSELAVGHPAGTSFCCSVAEMRGGLMARATEYWADDDHQPPAWRTPWIERY